MRKKIQMREMGCSRAAAMLSARAALLLLRRRDQRIALYRLQPLSRVSMTGILSYKDLFDSEESIRANENEDEGIEIHERLQNHLNKH